MAWIIKFTPRAQKELKKLSKDTSIEILTYLESKIAPEDNPRQFGHGLMHELSGFWRYRVGKYRIICEIRDDELIVLVISVAKRDKVYD